MALPRLSSGGWGFNAAMWDSLIDALETVMSRVVGVAVISGMQIAPVALQLQVSVSDGVFAARSTFLATSVPNVDIPPGNTSYVWVDDTGDFQTSYDYEAPGPNYGCLGRAVANGTVVTATDELGRTEFLQSVANVSQAGGYCAITVTSGEIVLTKQQYACRVIEFVGTPTGSFTVRVPAVKGYDWKFVNSLVGAPDVTISSDYYPHITVFDGSYDAVEASPTAPFVVPAGVTNAWSDGFSIRTA